VGSLTAACYTVLVEKLPHQQGAPVATIHHVSVSQTLFADTQYACLLMA